MAPSTGPSAADLKRIVFLLAGDLPPAGWEVLADSEKEFVADIIDEISFAIDAREGIAPTSDLASTPEARWWRQSEPLAA